MTFKPSVQLHWQFCVGLGLINEVVLGVRFCLIILWIGPWTLTWENRTVTGNPASIL